MKTKIGKYNPVVYFALSILMLGCSPTTISQSTPLLTSTAIATDLPVTTATVTLISASPTPTFMDPSAQELMFEPQDLGDGWILDAEVNDMDASYYMDRGEDGKAIIGKHRSTNKPKFEPNLVDSVSMRGFSQPDEKLVLYVVVTVFKELTQAKKAYTEVLVTECEPPCEYAGSESRDEYQTVPIADEAIRSKVWLLSDMEETIPFGTELKFRKGHVVVYLLSIGKWDDLVNAPPVDEERLEELARRIENQIP